MASNKIKGLTVEIGGDTTKLGKALEDVTKRSRDISSELGEINKMLKLDPKNTDLLSQKQKVLAEAISNTGKKLGTLKEAEKQVQAQFERGEVSEEQVRALKREIIATEQKLNGYEKAAKETAEQLENVGKKSEEAGDKTSGFGEKAKAAGKIAAQGFLAAGAAIAGLTVKAMSLAGELEQNMGGSEAVFGEYATKIQEKAKAAFSQMGLSTSDYLATANKMGSLFQGAGFETEEAMDLSSSAMQRAADVASIMGIDTSAAMEAVAGAAKGNFTMMDNLGVAMNDTTLNAYALSKGINKTTSQMTNQEKIGLAMEMFMDKTAYAAGNYAKENETLAGSLSTAKAALTNFLDGSGDAEGLVSSLSNLSKVIVEGLAELAPRLTSGLVDLVNQIMPMLPPLISSLLPVIIDGAVSLITGLVGALPGAITAILETIPMLIQSLLISGIPVVLQGAVDLLLAILQAVPQLLMQLVPQIPLIVMTVVNGLLAAIPQLVQGAVQFLLAIVQAIPQIVAQLVPQIPVIVTTVINGLLDNIPMLLEAAVTLLLAIVEAIPQICVELIRALPQIWSTMSDYLSGLPSKLWAILKTLVSKFVEFCTQSRAKAREGMAKVATAIIDTLKGLPSKLLNVGKDLVRGLWNGIKDMTGWVKDKIKGFGSDVLNGIKNFFGIKSPSRVMRDQVGKMLTAGLAEGIEDGAINAEQAAANMSDAVLGAAKGDLNGLAFERALTVRHDLATAAGGALNDSALLAKLDGIYARLGRLQMVTDTGTLVGELIDNIDAQLSGRQRLVARGVY